MDYTSLIIDIRKRVSYGKVIFVSGNFNIVHPGHLRLLRFAKECGDFLVVGIYKDGMEPGGVLPEQERLAGVAANIWVGSAFLLDCPPEQFIRQLQPEIVVKGREHESKFNPELETVESYGGKLMFSSGEVTFSSLELLNNEYRSINYSSIKNANDYLLRHGLEVVSLLERLKSFTTLKVAVVGDTIIDEYITCEPLGMSREEPTIVVTPLSSDRFVGGAAIVAAHAAALGAHVDFFSVTGDDEPAKFLGEKLKDYHVNAHLFTDDSRPTTLKQRFRTSGRSLLRVSHLRQHDITSPIRQLIIDEFKKIAPQTDLVIFSDFNYGVLPQDMVDAMAEICREHHILMVADSQSSSQTGDVSRFKNTALLTPTEHEARLAVRDAQSGLVILAEKLRKQADGKNLFLTLGEEGLLIHAVGATEGSWETDRIPALNSSPKDVAGAGDSLLTGASLVLASGGNIWESAFIGSLAAACQVGRLGNIPLTAAELDIEINRLN